MTTEQIFSIYGLISVKIEFTDERMIAAFKSITQTTRTSRTSKAMVCSPRFRFSNRPKPKLDL